MVGGDGIFYDLDSSNYEKNSRESKPSLTHNQEIDKIEMKIKVENANEDQSEFIDDLSTIDAELKMETLKSEDEIDIAYDDIKPEIEGNALSGNKSHSNTISNIVPQESSVDFGAVPQPNTTAEEDETDVERDNEKQFQYECEYFEEEYGEVCEGEGSKETDDLEVQEVKIEELLINCVEARPPLWDCRLPLVQRSKTIRDELWLEIYREFGEQPEFSIKYLMTKWRNLRDTYVRVKGEYESYKKSGSAAKKTKVWEYYENISFSRDTLNHRPTIVNIVTTPLTSPDEVNEVNRRKKKDLHQNKPQKWQLLMQ
ncbi:hypothetical protein JTB14_013805 [Gonioctena quinquepunctata]|nr:hypothetical protein JTB14_013805 [Gonioctena quinquepunctata]